MQLLSIVPLSLVVLLATFTTINAAAVPELTPAPEAFRLEPRIKPKIPKPKHTGSCGTATITSGSATSTVTGDAACDATATADDDSDSTSTSTSAMATAASATSAASTSSTSSTSRAGAIMAGGEINNFMIAGALGLVGLVL